MEQTQWEEIEPSVCSMKSKNLLRELMNQVIEFVAPENKPLIAIAVGDPTKYPNLPPPPSVQKALQKLPAMPDIHSYIGSCGTVNARTAVATMFGDMNGDCTIKDIFLCCGCTQAVEFCFFALLNPRSNDYILLPRPGFGLYQTICQKHDLKYKFYDCVASNNWAMDAQTIRQLINEDTSMKPKAILINNPSNPCGSVLTRQNMLEILELVDEYQIPIISDEIYASLVYSYDSNGSKNGRTNGSESEAVVYQSFSALKRMPMVPKYTSSSKTRSFAHIPILRCSGSAKQFLIPGWKLGWIVVDDTSRVIPDIRRSIMNLHNINTGPSSLNQAVLPDIIYNTPQSFFQDVARQLSEQSQLFCNSINNNPNIAKQLRAIPAHGAFYVMVEIMVDQFDDSVNNDIDFFEGVLNEQSLFIMPGTAFQMPNFFRGVVCAPKDVLTVAIQRLDEFCVKHKRSRNMKQSKL